MTASATFASNIVSFCEELEEFWAFVHLLKGMSQRLSHCCVREIVPLMELPSVKQVSVCVTYVYIILVFKGIFFLNFWVYLICV